MAEMLIDGAKLNACNTAEADAIRAKTGGSSPIPYDFANNKGFADAIAAIQTGGATETLLESGTFSKTEATNSVTIPTSHSGTATKILVVKDVEDEGVGEMLIWARVNVSEAQFPSALEGFVRTNYYRTSAGAHTFSGANLLRQDTVSIQILQASANYKINPGTYSWYIWGYPT